MLGLSWSLFGTKLVDFGIEIAFFAVWESSINLSCSWNRFSKAFGADAGQPESHSVLQIMGYRTHRLIEAKMASETNFGAISGGFGCHFGSQIGNLWLSMGSKWHLKPIENGI